MHALQAACPCMQRVYVFTSCTYMQCTCLLAGSPGGTSDHDGQALCGATHKVHRLHSKHVDPLMEGVCGSRRAWVWAEALGSKHAMAKWQKRKVQRRDTTSCPMSMLWCSPLCTSKNIIHIQAVKRCGTHLEQCAIHVVCKKAVQVLRQPGL